MTKGWLSQKLERISIESPKKTKISNVKHIANYLKPAVLFLFK